MENSVHEAKHAAKATVPKERDNACCRLASVIINFNFEAHNIIFIARGELIWVNSLLVSNLGCGPNYPQGGSAKNLNKLCKYKEIEDIFCFIQVGVKRLESLVVDRALR